jgi:RHS repeat-associated protein
MNGLSTMQALRSLMLLLVLLAAGPALGQEVIYYHTDALGTPVAITDQAGNVIERSEFEPYGELLNRPLEDGPGYTGHVSDAATGLVYMQQRYYDPMIPRFLSVDPVTVDSAGGNFNRYWYANNNPYKFYDPDGRSPVDDDPNRQPRAGGNAQPMPEADRINYQNGGAPTGKIEAQMRSSNPNDRLTAAKSAMAIAHVKGNSEDLGYNEALRGEASAATDAVNQTVDVGPDAFVSWSWLTSTLGHEFEVHVPQAQSLGPIRGVDDNDRREVEAHQYNVDNASRFHNTPAETQRHIELRDAYRYRLEH